MVGAASRRDRGHLTISRNGGRPDNYVHRLAGAPTTTVTDRVGEVARVADQAGKLATMGKPEIVEVKTGKLDVKFNLPRQGVSLLVLTGE